MLKNKKRIIVKQLFSEDGNDWSLFVFKNYYESQKRTLTKVI